MKNAIRDECPCEAIADKAEFYIRAACGDQRDWFSLEERLAIHLALEEEHKVMSLRR